jgi:hypothetical protein
MSSSSPQDESDFTQAQQVFITLVPAFTGTLSIIGSSCIIWMLLQENRKKLKSVKYRFLFALCCSDIWNSLVFVFWSLPIPKGTPGVWGAMGNKASCDAQGAFIQFGITSYYNCALALYYYKSLCFSMTDEQIAKRYEKWIHIGSVVWSLGTAIAAWQQDLYSYSSLGCWIAAEPLRCHRRDDVDCIRGEDAYIYIWLYTGIPQTLVFNYINYSMFMIYKKVKEVSSRAEKWTMGTAGGSTLSNPSLLEGTLSSDRKISNKSLHNRPSGSAVVSYRGSISGNDNRGSSRYAERTKEAAWQAFLYVNAYFVTHIWSSIVGMIELGGGTVPFSLLLIQNFFWPLQGFANVFIFLRPRIKSIQKRSPEIYYFTAAYHSVFHYDEVRQRATESVFSPARPDEESRPKSGTTNSTADSLRKATGEEGDTISTPATHAGMNETTAKEINAISTQASHGINEPHQEERFQRVIHEEACSSRHHADEEPTIAEDALYALFAKSAGPKGDKIMERSMSFDDDDIDDDEDEIDS